MLLRDLVEVNQKGNVTPAVNFDMLDKPKTNHDLCESFIFNYDPRRPDLSTVGILDRLQESFHSRNQPNIHMMIQTYGRGKSHFAVVLTNFFGKPADSPEVKGILEQVDKATSGKAKAIGDRLIAYKQRQAKPHLVLCLRGDKGGDIRKQFLQVVIKALKGAGVENAISTHICREPLNYLENLIPEELAKAEAYLKSQDNPDGDVSKLIQELKANNPSVIRTVKDVCRHVSRVAPDFQDDIDVEAILRDLLDNLCSGENACFSGLLILFDEMRAYLESWADAPIAAGGTALQNITNICDLYKGKIALLSFTQIHPSKSASISPTIKESYLQISSRLAPEDSTYDGPASSMELVVDNMLYQKKDTPLWQDFLHRWNDTLSCSARDAFEKYIKTYRQKGWTLTDFSTHLSIGCFPLHPITAYLLCSLNFTQDRTAIQFIKKYVGRFIEEHPLEENEQLNYMYPIALVDHFEDNFSQESESSRAVYERYIKAHEDIKNSDDPDEERTLQALFLYFASGQKITKKDDAEDHEEVLCALSGLSRKRLKPALERLEKTRDVILYKPEDKIYKFWEGINPTEIEKEVEDRIRDCNYSIHKIASYCTGVRSDLLGDQVYTAKQLVKDRKLVGEDWQFEIKFYTPDTLIRDLLVSERALRSTEKRGIFAYVVAETQEELQDLRRTIDDHLSRSPNRDCIVIALPSQEIGDLSQLFLKINELEQLDQQQKRLWGIAACEQILQRWEGRRLKRLDQILKSCSYHSIATHEIPIDQRNKPSKIISTLLLGLYRFVPPIEQVERLKSGHATGKKVTRVIAERLFADTFSPQNLPPDNYYADIIDKVFVEAWGLLKKTSSRYSPQEPTEDNVRAAWSEIDQVCAFNGKSEKTIEIKQLWQKLSDPPYGYNEYTFTVLLAGWLAYHRREVLLKGPEFVNRRRGQLANIRQFTLKECGNTDLFNDPIKFVNGWIIRDRAKLIRREGVAVPELLTSSIDIDQAQAYLNQANIFLESTECNPEELAGVRRTKEKIEAALEPVYCWFQPVEQVEDLPEEIDIKVSLELHTQLHLPLPTYSLDDNIISVRPTPEQRTRHSIATQAIAIRIEQYTEQVSLRSDVLETVEASNAYKAKVQNLIDTFNHTTNLPDHLIEIFQNALQAADLVCQKLEQDAHIQKLLTTAKESAQTLHDYASQADFLRVLNEINQIQKQVPSDRAEAADLQTLHQDIQRQYQELNQCLEAWQERLTSASAHSQYVTLLQEVAPHRQRFTEAESRDRLDRLEQTIQEGLDYSSKEQSPGQAGPDSEMLLKAELENANKYLQRLRDLPDSKIGEIAQVCQLLKNLEFSTTVANPELLERYREQLSAVKKQGHELVDNRLQQICDRCLTRLDLYESRKDLLNRTLYALQDVQDFESSKAQITQSLKTLETQAETLRQHAEEKKKQAEDKDVLKDIQQLKPHHNTTLYACELALAQIQELQIRLHYSEQAQATIQQVSHACENYIQGQKQALQSLQDRLVTINSQQILNQLSIDHARLEVIFRDSLEFETYQAVRTKISEVSNDLEILAQLETRYSQASSIAACNNLLEDLAQAQNLFKDPERFQESHLASIQEKVRQKIKYYRQDLIRIERLLADASTLSEVSKIQEIVLPKAVHYADSDEADKFDTLKQEIEVLRSLLPSIDITRAANLGACNKQIQELNSWQSVSGDLSQRIQDRIVIALEDLKQRRQSLLLEKQNDARLWLQSLNNKATQMVGAVRDDQKSEIADEIRKEIRLSAESQGEFLSSQEQTLLQEIKRQCLEQTRKQIDRKIIDMFKQIPPQHRKQLYKELEQYLDEKTNDQ